MLKKIIVPAFILLYFNGLAQLKTTTHVIDIVNFNDSALIVDNTLVFFDTANIATSTNILNQQFSPLKQFNYEFHIPSKLISSPAYIQFSITNSSIDNDTIVIFPGAIFDKIICYNKILPNEVKEYENISVKGFCKINLMPNETKTILLKLFFSHQDYNFLKPVLIHSHYFNTFIVDYKKPKEGLSNFGFIVSGMLLMMIIFVIVNIILTGRKEFFLYIAFATCMLLLVYFYALTGSDWGSFAGLFNGYLDLALLALGNIFYLGFTRYFLNTKTKYKTIDKVFRIGEWFLTMLLLIFTFIHFFTDKYIIERFLENAIKIIAMGIGILFIVKAFAQRDRLFTYLAIGSAANLFFSIISLVKIFVKHGQETLVDYSLFYYDLGLIFSLSFFLLGLSYKNRMELIDKIKEQEALKLEIGKQEYENQIALITAQQEERNRISADMHDDLGAGMTTIRLYSELAKNKLKDSPIPEIDKISSSANELLNKMNAIIWSMSSSNDTLGNMIAYIRSYAFEYLEDSGVACKVNIPINLPDIAVNGEKRRNIFLVVKEALNNVLKHSGASALKINIELFENSLKFSIHDNGKGIDFEKLRQFGNGLKNMEKRMKGQGMGFTIENNNGTLIIINVPIEIF